MRILATIPELEASACRASPAPEPRADDLLPADRESRNLAAGPGPGRRIRRAAKPRLPLGSIAALMALAVLAWTLAGWNDARRAGRQQAGERIAEQPASAEEPKTR